ncbi:putative phage holin [Kineococcus radiotolerans]|uniref:Uncharacterized protein n=1 Tax=Kineococcus radiotolerans (strain ATCC BAA-149 / DSM 14245 / SRS30216) TaxID=266940 RepID=A6W8P7_KINRD|nr:hypothetical protein [Kineococcus radiotolerans]ABS03186.1 hypothetical protein Krad_1700 [Kineococcus radiotolerans SRS30216 = ATCC BAA-149]
MSTSIRRHLVIGGLAVSAIIVGATFLTEPQLFIANMIGVSIAFLGCATFVVRYHFSTSGAWFGSATGRNVMLLMACLTAALGFILTVYLFGDYPLRRSVGAALYPLIGYAAWARVVLQSRAQSAVRAPKPDHLRRRRASDRDGESS